LSGDAKSGRNRSSFMATSAPEAICLTVPRPELVQRLVEGRPALTVIVAPAGYGKSTLLRDWEEHDDRPFLFASPFESGQLQTLVRRARRSSEGFVVVLDDAHLADPAPLRDALEMSFSALAPHSTIALASRSEPDLPIGRLRANRLLSEIRVPQLAMTSSEAAELLRLAGVELELEDLQRLVERTEGWPAALYLAALALREDPEALAHFDGQHHLVSEYLEEEVLCALPRDAMSFAVRTSVLDELSGPVCDVVLERRGSAVALRRLARANPLLVPVDPAHHCYRWHTLVREALTAELRQREPELEPALRLRAGGWYSGCGDASRAIGQAAAAGDAELTGELLWQNIMRYLTRGRNDQVRDWLANFCSDRVASSASLAMSASLSALINGDLQSAQHWSFAAAAALDRQNARQGRGSVVTGIAVVEAVSARCGAAKMGELARNAAVSEPEDSLWRPICSLLEAIASYLQGDRGTAERQLDETIRFSGNRAPIVTSIGLAQRAMIELDREDWELAAELSDRAAMVAEEWDLKQDPLSAIVFAAAAASRAHDGRIDEAKRDLRHGIDLLAALGDFVPWYGAEARILLAYASLWLADTVGARTLLAEASRFARRTAEATIFANWFDHAWAYLDTIAETSLAGPSSLTIAELRILRFLPSHRSFREIAAQLGVSANTVKTQAHAVYRKLGAASRSEAVAQAIDAGLLGP
jgi:LuxR family transcriptional regulator, maltose regulon positive regulatory protein